MVVVWSREGVLSIPVFLPPLPTTHPLQLSVIIAFLHSLVDERGIPPLPTGTSAIVNFFFLLLLSAAPLQLSYIVL